MKRITILILAGLLFVASTAMAQFGNPTATKIQGKSGGTVTATNDRLDVNVQGASASGVEVIQDTAADLNATVTQTSGVNFDVEGVVAEGATDSANPISTGMKAESTVPTEVDDGNIVKPWADTYGRQTIRGYNLSTGSLDATVVAPIPVNDACVHLLDVTVDANGESFNGTMYIGNAKKLTIMAWDDETASADDSQVDLTIELSPDGTALMTAGTAMINSEDLAQVAAADLTFDTDEERFFYFADQVTAQKLKATVTCDADCDGSDYHAFDLWVCTND